MSIIRADSIKNRAGDGAPDFPNGITVTGIVTATTLNNVANNIDVDDFISVGNNIHLGNAGVCTATSFSGSGASLTSLPAGNLTGALPAISGANLTGISTPIHKIHYYEHASRVVTSSSADVSLVSFTFTKDSATTKIYCTCVLPTWNNSTNGGTYMYLQLTDGSNTVRQQRGMSRPYMTEGESGTFSINTRFGTTFNAGTITVTMGWDTANNQSNRPFTVLNPNASDDGRNPQMASVYFFYEVNE